MITLSYFHALFILLFIVVAFFLIIKFTRVKFIIDPLSTSMIREKVMSEITEDVRQKLFEDSLPEIEDDLRDYILESNQDLIDKLRPLISEDLLDKVIVEMNDVKIKHSNKPKHKEFDLDASIDGLK